jgi:squalene-associated FAD-dependent desaturase
VVIVGGGLAGIAAAIRLADAECEPILIESKKRLGGRATSLVDPRSGLIIDNCQHVLMGCCTNLIDLYDRLDVLDRIQWHDRLFWTRNGIDVDVMTGGWLPAPLHMARSFNRMRLFSRADKRRVARAMWRIIRMGTRGRFAWHERTFLEFLACCHQPQALVRSFWNTIVVSACNLPVDRVGASLALQVFQDGFLASKWSVTMGLPAVPLGELYDAAIDAIERAGGRVLLGVSAKAISFDGSRVTGVVTDEGFVEGAAVVSAAPFDRLDKLVSDTVKLADRRLQQLDRFEVSPILGVHLWFDQVIMPPELPHLVCVDPPVGVQWLFNKSFNEHGRQHIHAVISAADEWMALDEKEIVRRVMVDVHHCLPRSKGLRPVEARSIKEKRATFAAVPGVDAWRPSVAPGAVGSGFGGGGIENLFLAGDWTDTGWPATMEGAVRSGYSAAQAITGKGGVVEDVPPGWLARWLGLR